jgi:hypothetical protein
LVSFFHFSIVNADETDSVLAQSHSNRLFFGLDFYLNLRFYTARVGAAGRGRQVSGVD